jgi:hypothetical protein
VEAETAETVVAVTTAEEIVAVLNVMTVIAALVVVTKNNMVVKPSSRGRLFFAAKRIEKYRHLDQERGELDASKPR